MSYIWFDWDVEGSYYVFLESKGIVFNKVYKIYNEIIGKIVKLFWK